jgi:hypothetical protein
MEAVVLFEFSALKLSRSDQIGDRAEEAAKQSAYSF